MPGSHQHPSSDRLPPSAPPAPEWRVPAAPPKPSHAAVASPPPPPLPPSYNPNLVHAPSYGPPGNAGANALPVSGFPGVNTATWGVNYNRQTQMQSPPPLPPRPSSTGGQQPNVPSPIVSSADPYQPSTAPSYGSQVSGNHYQQWASKPPYAPQQPITSVPPPPPPPPPLPPLPAVDASIYQNRAPPLPTVAQTHQTWNQPPPPPPPSYPNIPPSQYHPPSSGPSQPSPPPAHPIVPPSQYHPPISVPGQSTPPPPAHQPSNFYQKVNAQPTGSIPPEGSISLSPAPAHVPAPPPVPPKASPLIIPTGASALGSGGPSDWEHLSPVVGDVDDLNAFKPRRDPPVNVVHERPPSHGSGPTGTIPNSHSPTPSFSSPEFTKSEGSADASQYHSTQSPISPGTRQDSQPPPQPVRTDTAESGYTTVSVVANSENIDGVIEAWNKPIVTENEPLTIQHSPKVEHEPVSPHLTPSPIETTPAKKREPAELAKETKIDQAGSVKDAGNETARNPESPRPQSRQVDRYEDLDSWSQSSLERYVAMLRKEAVADSLEERFRIFTAFMAKETKLREILYNIDHDTKAVADTQQQPADKQTPVKEPEENKPKTKPTPDESGLIPVESEDGYFNTGSNVDEEEEEEEEEGNYSPGGRPILPRLHTPHPPALHRSASNPGGHKHSASHTIPAHSLRSTSVPPILIDEAPKTTYSPLTTNPPQRIYTPFRYTEGPQRGSDKLSFDRPAYQAYSALRQASAESGRVMADAPPPALTPTEGNRNRSDTSSVKDDQDETFVGLIREKSVNYRSKTPQTSMAPPLPASLRQGKPLGPVEDLRTVTSTPVNKQSESLWHTTVRKDLEKYPNDFGFVREIFKPWEAASKARRESLDKERIRRQEESEHHIDALFNEKEIGYADINILEEEFRQTEARTQLEEERQELEDFISNVFNAVDKRLEDEISTLQVHYDSALSQLDRENSNKEEGTDKHSISHTMKIVNETHHKLEMRHHKRLEIALDRERRRKKAERRPLVFMGDSAALKKLDNEFDQMEKQNILEVARARDERANKLMDLFDDVIMRGLGENQSLLDELLAKVARVDEAAIRSSGLPDAEIEQVLKSVYSLVEYLRKDSESILESFGVADSALNNADYSVSVAEARYSNSEPDVFRQLDAEKKKEDAKIRDNLRTKLQSVRVGPAKITVSINDALRVLGKTPFPDQPVPSDVIPASHLYDVSLPNPARPASTTGIAARKLDGDPEHRERLRKALEDAKKRNAARQRSPSAVSKE
ncbi:hypothetical protein BDW62DRAFT_177288 [Aspergillus aurantiobrunneus]